jgi:adenosylcobinamide-phosphate synthase
MVWHVLILYVTLGFRQFSFHFTGIRDALEEGDEEMARTLLARWQRVDVKDLPPGGTVRQVICHSVLAAHRHVFGVLAWYSVLAAFGLGPVGAVFYRLSEFVARYWTQQQQPARMPVSDALQAVSMGAWRLVDWLPARLTAFTFAVVGHFEDTIDGWRSVDQSLGIDNDGVILAATAGAVGLNLHAEPNESNRGPAVEPERRSQARTDKTPEFAHLRSIVGLVWRSVVLWMLLLAMLTVARSLG